jgi:hypothetical protein
MSGETDLNELIATMHPELRDGTYVFVTMPLDGADPVALGAVMSFREDEGVTMIVPDHAASAAGLTGVFPCRIRSHGQSQPRRTVPTANRAPKIFGSFIAKANATSCGIL